MTTATLRDDDANGDSFRKLFEAALLRRAREAGAVAPQADPQADVVDPQADPQDDPQAAFETSLRELEVFSGLDRAGAQRLNLAMQVKGTLFAGVPVDAGSLLVMSRWIQYGEKVMGDERPDLMVDIDMDKPIDRELIGALHVGSVVDDANDPDSPPFIRGQDGKWRHLYRDSRGGEPQWGVPYRDEELFEDDVRLFYGGTYDEYDISEETMNETRPGKTTEL